MAGEKRTPGYFDDFFLDMPSEKRWFMDHALRREMGRNEILYFSGDVAGSVYYLESGRVKASKVSAGGEEAIISIHVPGSIMGLGPAMSGQDRNVNVQAMTPAVLYEVRLDDFMRMLEVYPGMVRRVVADLHRRISYLIELYAGMVFNNPETRLIRLLGLLYYDRLLQGRKTGLAVSIPAEIVQRDIASAIGTSRQTANQALKRLAERGVVALSKKAITVHKPDVILRAVEM